MNTDTLTLIELSSGQRIYAHRPTACAGQFCTIHNPSNHSMREFWLHWREDRGFLERICPHGVGHPDPDQIAFWFREHGREYAEAHAVHGCDGCGHE